MQAAKIFLPNGAIPSLFKAFKVYVPKAFEGKNHFSLFYVFNSVNLHVSPSFFVLDPFAHGIVLLFLFILVFSMFFFDFRCLPDINIYKSSALIFG